MAARLRKKEEDIYRPKVGRIGGRKWERRVGVGVGVGVGGVDRVLLGVRFRGRTMARNVVGFGRLEV